MTESMLEARSVSRNFISRQGLLRRPAVLHAVDNVSFELAHGESLGFVGESGCGKSTLGRMICGLLPPTSGEIRLQGKTVPVAGAKSWARGKLQMVFQDPASSLNPRLKVGLSVAEPLLACGQDSDQARARSEELLGAVGLAGAANRYPHQFSGGQRQRIAIARALASRPDAIVCDEPVSALDASVQAQILNLFQDVRDKFGVAYIFISHSLAVVGFMCPRIAVMYLGQIVEDGPRDALFENPGHPYTRILVDTMPQGESAWSHGRQKLPPPLPSELPSPINRPKGCFFHPRCPSARPICKETPPPWRELGPRWRARCHFAGEGSAI